MSFDQTPVDDFMYLKKTLNQIHCTPYTILSVIMPLDINFIGFIESYKFSKLIQVWDILTVV